ncbi:MAG: response regulator, partial [Deltaproteobacteria bacterium]
IRLQQIVSNLLNNAVKFTPAGGCVELRIERADRAARLVVRDTGRGIAPEFLPQIFEPFRQADDVKTRTAGGLGLGLAIARSLVQQHGGTVKAESAGEGTGSTFTVTLPLMDGTIIEAAERESDLPRRPVPRLDGLRVLIVDDELEACEALGVLLEERGAKVTMVASVPDARAALDNWEPDVLVSDIRMPGEDGYALVRELRATGRLRAVPAVAITGYDQEGDRAAAAGFHACFRKPVEPDNLVTLLASLAGR